jgi:hypothetical protein
VVNYKEKGYRFDSDGSDSEGPGGRRRKRVPADDADDFDAAAAEGEAGDDDMLPHKKKHKKREVGYITSYVRKAGRAGSWLCWLQARRTAPIPFLSHRAAAGGADGLHSSRWFVCSA